jgi:alanine dehydrogenase
MGVYILSDPATAVPLAVMDATLLTAFRTGAAAAVATKYCAPRAPRSVGLVGAGVQARVLHDAHRALFGAAFEVLVADVVPAAAEKLAQELGARVATVAEASACDVVCTSTPSRKPVVFREWLRPGAHVNAMGADAPGKQELDGRILLDARVFVDDLEQASHSGEINVPLHDGALRSEQLAGTIGQVVAGLVKARSAGDAGAHELTVFDSTGLAIQDVALAKRLHDAAMSAGVGLDVDLVG